MDKKACLTVLMFAIFFSSIAVTIVYAQSISKPSVPEFTLVATPAYYNVTTTDPYTGENTTIQVNNSTVEITIKNQPKVIYSSNGTAYSVFYDIRVKGHFGENWRELFNYFDYAYSWESRPRVLSAASHDTVFVYNVGTDYPGLSSAQLDFQVEAITMYEGQVHVAEGLWDLIGHYEAGQVVGPNSGWTETQTIQLPAPFPSAPTNFTPPP